MSDLSTPYTSSDAKHHFAIVGLGASAGGLQAVITFFEQMPADADMAFIVVLHLSPEHPSEASSILQRATRMPVSEVMQATTVEAAHVYVIAPNRQLSMVDGMLRVTPLQRKTGAHVAIDTFFRTMADAHRERCFGVLLSGTGSDGVLGMTHVRAQGGVTLAQHPDDAEYADMPLAAIRADAVDFILPVAAIAHKLMELWDNTRRIRLPVLSDTEVLEVAHHNAEHDTSAEQALRDIISTLHARTGHDFSHYKRATMLRRLERRLQVRAVPDLATYRGILQQDPGESEILLKDLLIGVTQFFRDRDTFDALERDVMPALFEHRAALDPIRLWVTACSTGEEAYSLGMLLCDQANFSAAYPGVQIFATDIDEHAIAVARAGLYAQGIVSDLPSARLGRYFDKEGSRYRIKKSLRENVMFASHNLLRDPPFSKLDMISCRNLLIYLNREAQTRILETFHFALKPDGILLLGSSESADMLVDHFVPVDKKNRIYRAKPIRPAFKVTAFTPVPALISHAVRRSEPVTERRPSSYGDLHDRALARTAAPSLIINSNGDVVHMSAQVGKFLRHADGEPSRNVISLIIPELRLDLRSILFQVEQNVASTRTLTLSIPQNGQMWDVEMIAKPFVDDDSGDKFTVVMFEERLAISAASQPGQANEPVDAVILSLEQNLQRTTVRLQDTIEQAEASGEELKASNEELQAINEELRSATEELETGKEELQSVNEELLHVNNEMKNKIDETSKANDDLQNLIASSDIATLFVDREMRVKRYTPRATDIFNIIPGDIGRLLSHITHKLEFDALASDAARTFETLRLVEREVRSTDGKHYLARMLPYRTLADRIEGALLTFIDVTALRRAEARLRAADARMRLVAASTMDYAIVTLDTEGRITSFNKGAERLYGYHEEEMLGQSVDALYTPEDRAAHIPVEERKRAHETGRAEDERWHVKKDGGRFFCSGVITPLLDGQFHGYAKIGRDLTGRVEAEALRNRQFIDEQRQRAEAQAANNLKDEFLAIMSHELKHPLNLIHINAELLLRFHESKASPAITKATSAILNAAVSQAKIIDDLLDFSRINTGKLALSLTEVDLCQQVKALVPVFEADPAAAGLKILCEEIDLPVLVMADAVRINQVITNLISNAVKFSRPAGEIVIRISKEGGQARLDVIDNGQGIAPESLHTIFDMFKQSQFSTTRSSIGLGIGLALVRQIVELQGGSVEVHSDGLRTGAQFTVRLPLVQALAVTPAHGPSVTIAGVRILIVDDSPDIVETFQMLLQMEGALVVAATSGAQALAMLDTDVFDLIISDIGMPGMDGYSFLKQARTRPACAAIPAIALTGFGRPKDAELAAGAGFTAYIRKPVAIEDLLKLITSLPIGNLPRCDA